MAEIKPKQPRGQKAHEDAIRDEQTCLECHANLVHRYVEVRATPTKDDSEEGMDEGLDDLDEGLDDLDEGLDGDSGDGSEELEVL